MFPILYESITAGTVPQHNGVGVLSDCISCVVEQVRNGLYELTMEYPLSGIHAEDVSTRRVIKAKPNPTDNPQLFRISRVGKVMNDKFTVYAKQIGYDLSGYEITSGTASGIVNACSLLQASASGWTISTDKSTAGNFRITEPSSVRSWFGGKEGSILDVFGGADIRYDNFNVQFLNSAGQDRGVTIRYGKNLLELSQEIEDTLFTDVLCYYKNEETVVVGNKVSTGLTLDVPKCLIVDCSQDYESAPTIAQLTTKAEEYRDSHNLTVPSNNIKLDYVQSEELSDRVDLCDTVSIYYEALGITRAGAKCIRTKYDCIKEKYIETEFGDVSSDLSDTLSVASKRLAKTPTTTFMQDAVRRATSLITGNLGGYVVLHDSNGDGEPDEILIMNTPDITTSTKLWRFNKNGLGYSNTGYDGEYGLAMTSDGEIVADFITTGEMSGNRVRTGIIVSQNNELLLDLDNGTITAPSITLNGQDVGSTLNDLVQTSVVTRYALSNSGTIMPEDFPLTSPTQPTEQQPFLWSRTIYTYANGQTNTSYGVSVRGANGRNGADGAGLSILGNYETMADLIADHPTGTAGEAYMVGTDLVVWNTQTNSWQNVGRIQGPSGSDGFWLTVENDDDGTNANVTYTAHLMKGVSDVTATYSAIFDWQLVKEEGITDIGSDITTITVSRDSANYGATIRCICLALVDEEDLEDYTYVAISDYSGNIIQIIGDNNFKLIGDSAIYKPYAISSQFQVLQDEISSKVEQSDFNSLSNTVTHQGTLIQQNSNQIALKANQTTVDNLSGTVSSQGTAIEQNAQQITLKANTSTVNQQMAGKMSTDMSNRSSSITINSGEMKFESNTISISATNLTVTKSGLVTAVNFVAKRMFRVVDDNNIVFASIEPQTNGGMIAVGKPDGTQVGTFYSASDGAAIGLANSSGNQTIALSGGTGNIWCENVYSRGSVSASGKISGSSFGTINVKDSNDNTRGLLWIDQYNHGDLYLYDEYGTANIREFGSGEIICVSLTQTSSRKVKENIKPMTNEEAEKILNLDAVSFDYKNKAQGTDKRGFIAEDVAEVLPNLVREGTDDMPTSLDYIGMIPYLVKLVQKQQKEIDTLKAEIDKLKEN